MNFTSNKKRITIFIINSILHNLFNLKLLSTKKIKLFHFLLAVYCLSFSHGPAAVVIRLTSESCYGTCYTDTPFEDHSVGPSYQQWLPPHKMLPVMDQDAQASKHSHSGARAFPLHAGHLHAVLNFSGLSL